MALCLPGGPPAPLPHEVVEEIRQHSDKDWQENSVDKTLRESSTESLKWFEDHFSIPIAQSLLIDDGTGSASTSSHYDGPKDLYKKGRSLAQAAGFPHFLSFASQDVSGLGGKCPLPLLHVPSPASPVPSLYPSPSSINCLFHLTLLSPLSFSHNVSVSHLSA